VVVPVDLMVGEFITVAADFAEAMAFGACMAPVVIVTVGTEAATTAVGAD
jgi:hypothetical protein